MAKTWVDDCTPMQKRVAVEFLSDAFVALLKLNGVGIFSTQIDIAAVRVQELLKQAVEAI